MWKELQTIPYGSTRSYLGQATAMGKSSSVRAVANANGMNRIAIIIPCHRVIGEDGSPTGYGGGIWRKKWLLDLVAIGTIADLMPLLGENRTLVSYGLIVLGKTKRLGLRKLIEKAGNGVGEITEKTVGFTIAPRLNAAGRLEHASTAYQLLVTDNQAEAEVLAESINQTNQQRQQLTEQITREARQQIANQKDEGLLVAIGDGWPTGILGLVILALILG